ncbi:Crp/Fnr family transcriptional regulator [Parabacteroides faecis]|uniref:Crp/Fnr family transcriptional regulator n=1 Tax=Parabacteroides TaxID=375288 RepID=UPI000EFDBEE2|nr:MULTISPECIES: Crp/Fnr family transcriptional regulator [Parabacteroides]MBC8618420.1 Crp/Fnr family transcriptional regulator [Parabacteroides faecis]RHR93252.1 Crp/Fnr family transcriptional regulator [Parabacteroides sp. AF14-59]
MIDLKEFVSRLNISEELSGVFMEMGEIVNLKRKEYFVRQGEPCRYLGAVLDGQFRFSHCDAEGEERTIGFNTNGFATEYHAFLNHVPAKYSIQAISEVVVYRMTYQQVIDFYEYNMESQRFGRHIAEQLFFCRDELVFSFRCDTPEERYKKLLKVADHSINKLTLKDVASLIGVTPETVSRIRRKLSDEDES